MVGRQKKKSAPGLLLVLLLLFITLNAFSQKGRTAKINNLYSCLLEYKIECPKTVLAIAVYETGWMECKNCSYQYNNLFGFRSNRNYVRFKNIYECIEYLKVWQETYYDPWKARHPRGSYYDFLVHIRYARSSMSNYLKTIKSVERLVSKNVKDMDATIIPDIEPGLELQLDTVTDVK